MNNIRSDQSLVISFFIVNNKKYFHFYICSIETVTGVAYNKS